MEKTEKEIISSMNINAPKKKLEALKQEYARLQKSILTDLFKKTLNIITPIEFKIFASKYLRLKNLEQKPGENLDKTISNINDNQEM